MNRLILAAATVLALLFAAPMAVQAQPARENAETPAQPLTGTADAGAAIFRGKCSECHWTTRLHGDSMGPNLDGFYGKAAAGEARYCCYTIALKMAHLTWDDATLDKWLTGPGDLVPGTWMRGFPGLKDPQQRADVIAYLKTLNAPR